MTSSQLLNVSYKHPSSFWSFADKTLTLIQESVLTVSSTSLTTLAEKAVVSCAFHPPHCMPFLWHLLTDCSVLQNITVGRLRIVTNERIYEFPERVTGSGKDDELHAELRVINDAFWVRLCMMGDLGFAEAYMFGDVICEDLISIFLVSTLDSSLLLILADLDGEQVFLENKQNLTSLKSTVSWLFSLPQRLTSFRFLNSLGNARFNVSAHYDLSDSVFKGVTPI
jgi:cyclopropane-fatty-acyl-phospholipid synthase